MKEGDQWYVYSQFEPTDARRAFPCFDEPRFKVPWQLTLHVPKDDVALANSPELSETDEPDGMKAVKFKESKPLPSYLVALAVGTFDIVDAGKVGKTPLRIITPRGKARTRNSRRNPFRNCLSCWKIISEFRIPTRSWIPSPCPSAISPWRTPGS